MSVDWPKLSIVTPTLNHGRFLEATIQSVLSQEYPNLEYIVIDGGSSDESVEILEKYDRRLHFWCSEPDDGHYDAVNKGFARATGDILAWLNSGDAYLSWTFATVGSLFRAVLDVSWLTTLSPINCDYHGFCVGVNRISGFAKQAFLDGCYLEGTARFIGYVQQEATFWRRELWERAGSRISTEYSLAGDFDLWARFYLHADLYGVNAALAAFRYHEKQRSAQRNKYLAEARRSLREMGRCVGPALHSDSGTLAAALVDPPQTSVIGGCLGEYRGKKIVRRDPRQPDAYWEVEEYTFR